MAAADLVSCEDISMQRIEDYGVIGNMRSAALVSVTGSIDFFCFRSFDSPTVFASLLDDDNGGYFRIDTTMTNARSKQLYLPDTNILLTRFLAAEGVAEITDFMPVTSGDPPSPYAHQIIRMVRAVRGDITFRLVCAPRFDYARCSHTVHAEEQSLCFHPQGASDSLSLHATVPLGIRGMDGVADFTLSAGQTACFVLGDVPKEETSPVDLLNAKEVARQFDENCEVLARVDCAIEVHGALARNGEPFSAGTQTTHQP